MIKDVINFYKDILSSSYFWLTYCILLFIVIISKIIYSYIRNESNNNKIGGNKNA